MKRKSIIDELFRGTLVLFVTLLLFQVILQRMFTDFFYIESKAKNMRSDIESLEQSLTDQQFSLEQKNELIESFRENHNAVIQIVDPKGGPLYDKDGNMTVSMLEIVSSDNQRYRIFIEDRGMAEKIFPVLSVGKSISCRAMLYQDSPNIFPLQIMVDGMVYNNVWGMTENVISMQSLKNKILKQQRKAFETVLHGTVLTMQSGLQAERESGMHRERMLQTQIIRFQIEYERYQELLKKQVVYFLTSDNEYQMENIFFAEQMRDGNIFFAMVPLQSVSEAAEILKNLYVYLFAIAMLLIGIGSYFFSRTVTKPLLNMNNVACKMAALDFSEKCIVHSNDELGDLAKSINTMSSNLEKYMRDLEKANRELKRDIVEERKQDQLRRELVANISHEFKTPLTVIKGTVEGIRDGVYHCDDAVLQSLLDETTRLNKMVFDMLELSRIESNNYTLNTTLFDLWEKTLRVYNAMKVMAKQKNLSVHFDGDESPVFGDEVKIEQVITNLFTNAVRYSNANESIIITLKQAEGRCRFSIINTGAFLIEDELERIWDGFYRVEKSRNRESGGTGLGLLIVKRILELHQSRYGVRNTDQGIEFYFDLKAYTEREKTKLEQADEALQSIASSVKQITENLLKHK